MEEEERDHPQVGVDGVSRRNFLGRGVAVAGGVTLLGGSTAQASRVLTRVAEAASYKPVALTAAEFATLQAALAQLLPRDELGPGAVEAGVGVYIDRALADAYQALLPAYRSLLPLFDKAAASMGAASFSRLSASKKVALLEKLELGQAPGVSKAQATALAGFFQLLLEHMREGMFADPMYGGNRHLAGWKLLNYPDAQLEVTAKQQAIGTKVKPNGKTAKSYGGIPFNGPSIS